jgi:hypothetical protein
MSSESLSCEERAELEEAIDALTVQNSQAALEILDLRRQVESLTARNAFLAAELERLRTPPGEAPVRSPRPSRSRVVDLIGT